jgi:cytoskeletal protein RodZ
MTDSAPTDLSHLINNPQPETVQPAPETLVVPSAPAANPEAPTVSTESHKGGIPKWLLGIGGGLLIVVIGASAYFILGVGQPAKTTTSIPATTVSRTAEEVKPAQQPVAAPAATPVAQPAQQPAATGSASFGALQGNNATASAQPSSAAELLRQRQLQQGK